MPVTFSHHGKISELTIGNRHALVSMYLHALHGFIFPLGMDPDPRYRLHRLLMLADGLLIASYIRQRPSEVYVSHRIIGTELGRFLQSRQRLLVAALHNQCLTQKFF